MSANTARAVRDFSRGLGASVGIAATAIAWITLTSGWAMRSSEVVRLAAITATMGDGPAVALILIALIAHLIFRKQEGRA